jgi:hypothetical protein
MIGNRAKALFPFYVHLNSLINIIASVALLFVIYSIPKRIENIAFATGAFPISPTGTS